MGQAERAVYISGALIDAPSLLEVECAGRLDATLHPGLRHLLQWLSDLDPRLVPLATCADEVFLLLSTLLHYHYLRQKGSSFGESFYGLTRVDVEDKALDEKARLSSLLCLTALPYLCLKLQQKLSLYRLQLADGVLFYEPERKLKQLGSWLGGLMYAGVRWWHVAELASGGCSVPELRMQGLRLGPSHSGAEPGALLQGLAFVAQLGTASGEQDNHPHSPRTVSVPGPPVYHQRAAEHAGRCPLCFRSPVLSPTAVAPSGYVFCFGCIVHHVQGARAARCPVTHLPISLQHLVRIYKTHSS